ncbi:MAG: hypothetical protein EOP45_15045 [Sphingobacteriaceae bacterium]|nr:MAG: hypothetical protein EOP45_15045 [Sphingobacteriaceae bacterium]
MYLSLIFYPLLGSLLAALFGRFLGFRGAALVTTTSVFLSFLMSCIAFYEVALSGSGCYIKYSGWFVCEMFDRIVYVGQIVVQFIRSPLRTIISIETQREPRTN